MRTCVGCRGIVPQRELVRVGWVGPHLAIGRVTGRGAYIHRSQVCFDAAVRGGFARAFRRSIPNDEIRNFAKNVAGLDGAKAVETLPRPPGPDGARTREG